MRMRNAKSCVNLVLSGIIVYRATSIRIVKVSMYHHQRSFRSTVEERCSSIVA